MNDLALYERDADGWWDPDHPSFRSLRSVKAFHLELLLDCWDRGPAGADVVDLGCGGGLFGLPLAERGASVVGVDLSGASVRAAADEAARRGLAARFVQGDLTAPPLADASADLVLLSDVLEHVADPARAIGEAARLVRPDGMLFVNTFDRRPGAGLVVVTLAEGIGLVPRGTHDPRLFVRPAEVSEAAAAAGLERTLLQWERPALWRTARAWRVHLRRASSGFGYTAVYRRPMGEPADVGGA